MGKQEDVDACNDDDDDEDDAEQQQQLHGSGILLQHYDHLSCVPSWRVSCSSIVYSPAMASGTASEVKGAVFTVRGEQAYRFQATAATISASSQPHSVLHITGDLEVSDDAMTTTMHCKNLTWDAVSRVLKLGGPVAASTATAATASSQLDRDCSDDFQATTTDNSICHAHVWVPAAYFNSFHPSGVNFKEWVARNMSRKGALFVKLCMRLWGCLGTRKKNLPRKSEHDSSEDAAVEQSFSSSFVAAPQDSSLLEVIISAEKGVVIDMEGSMVSSPGVLSIACPARQTRVRSGAGIMLFGNGVFLALHGGVVARIQAFNLKAQKISCRWFDDKNQQGRLLSSRSQPITGPPEMLRPESQAVVGTRPPKKSAGIHNGEAVDEFNAKVNRIHRQRPPWHIEAHFMRSHMSRIESSYAARAAASRDGPGSSSFVLRKGKGVGNLTGILQAVCQQVVSALHVSFRTSEIRDFVGVDFNVSRWFSDDSEFAGLRTRNVFSSLSSVQEELDTFHRNGKGAVLVAQGDVRIWWQ